MDIKNVKNGLVVGHKKTKKTGTIVDYDLDASPPTVKVCPTGGNNPLYYAVWPIKDCTETKHLYDFSMIEKILEHKQKYSSVIERLEHNVELNGIYVQNIKTEETGIIVNDVPDQEQNVEVSIYDTAANCTLATNQIVKWNINDISVISDALPEHNLVIENKTENINEKNAGSKQISPYEQIAEEVGKLVVSKNKSYGNSFGDSAEFLKILYPNGVPVDAYDDMLCIVRIFDKLKRISTNKPLETENKLDAYKDIVGYGILGVAKTNKEKENNE